MYWSSQAKAALDAQLLDASRNRTIYRVIEPTESFTAEQKGQAAATQSQRDARIRGEAIITRYRDGAVNRIAGARTAPDYGSVEWLD